MSSRGRSDLMINNANAFALLGKKKSKGKSSAAKNGIEKSVDEKVFWAPAPLTVKSWADVDDEDDDDYYATTAPPVGVWGSTEQGMKEESLEHVEESESDEEVLGGEDTDLDEEHVSEPEIQETHEPAVKSAAPVIVVKEPERQLSKKEIKKKEQEDFDAILADLKITPTDKAGHEENQGAEVKKKDLSPIGAGEKDESATAESKNSKKKKRKAKSTAKEVNEIQTHEEETNGEKAEENGVATVDVKEQLKKLAAMKKKKPSKETDISAKAAATEAAARRQKLEAAKKKEKSHHYNQQPVR